MSEGTVLRRVGGFLTVAVDGEEWLCVLRGRVKRAAGPVLAGDRVEVRAAGAGRGVVEAVLPRKNQLTRPAVANVNQVVVVTAAATPRPPHTLLDRILAHVEAAGLAPLLCCNKADLVTAREVEGVLEPYRGTGYPLLVTSARTGEGIAALRAHLQGKVTALAGVSGVGKSSLLNALEPSLARPTGDVSERLAQGRHTTRSVELLRVGDGLVADTPGFNQLEAPAVPPQALDRLFPEVARLAGDCGFDDCLHRAEPGCAVREGVEAGQIHPSRYESYLTLLAEIQQREEERY